MQVDPHLLIDTVIESSSICTRFCLCWEMQLLWCDHRKATGNQPEIVRGWEGFAERKFASWSLGLTQAQKQDVRTELHK